MLMYSTTNISLLSPPSKDRQYVSAAVLLCTTSFLTGQYNAAVSHLEGFSKYLGYFMGLFLSFSKVYALRKLCIYCDQIIYLKRQFRGSINTGYSDADCKS